MFFKIKFFINILILFFLFSFFNTACKTHKNKAKTVDTVNTDSILLNFSSHAFLFENMQAKVNITVDNKDNKNSFNATARLKRDSIIWMSVAPFLGIEVFRIVFTQDSVKILNRLNSTYFLSDINGLKKMLQADVDFNMMQSVIIGNDFPHFDFSKFQVGTEGGHYILTANNRAKLRNTYNNSNLSINQQIFLSSSLFRIVKNFFSDIEEKYKFEVVYADFKTIENQQFAHNIKTKLTSNKEMWDIGIEFQRVQLTQELVFPFSIPDNYTKMPTQ